MLTHLQLDDLAVQLVDSLGLGGHLDLQLGSGFVHQIDGFVRQEPLADIPVLVNICTRKLFNLIIIPLLDINMMLIPV